jgi:hypothetical protein
MSVIAAANSSAYSALALLLNNTASASTDPANPTATSTNSSAPEDPEDRIELSDYARATLARAKSEQAAAEKLNALLLSLTGRDNDAPATASSSISVSTGEAASQAEVFAPKVSFAGRLSAGGFSVFATGNADTWSSNIRIEGPNGLKITSEVFGGGQGMATAESGGVSGLPAGMSYMSQKIGNKQYFTISSASAAASAVAVNGHFQAAVAAEATSTTIVIDFDTGGISMFQSEMSTLTTMTGVETSPWLPVGNSPSAENASVAASAYTSDRAKQITMRANAERSVVEQLNAQLDGYLGGSRTSVLAFGSAGNDVIKAYHNAAVWAGAGNDVVKTYGNAYVDGGRGNDRIATHGNSIVRGGAGNDRINTYDHSIVSGGSGNDRINTYGHSIVSGGSGNDRISTYGHSIVSGDAGNDRISTYGHSIVSGGSGNDRIDTYDHSIVDGGGGNDRISTYDHSIANGGDGNDVLSAYDNSILDGGAGNDRLSAYSHANLSGGAGNDTIDAYYHAVVDAGSGDDSVRTYGHAVVSAGRGNDSVKTGDSSVVDGGEGDDFLQVGGHSSVTGGAGDDSIRVTGENVTVNFGKGDGHDVVKGHDDVTVAITGYTKDDVIVTRGVGNTLVTFKGSDDSLVLDIDSWAAATLTFADGSSLDVDA